MMARVIIGLAISAACLLFWLLEHYRTRRRRRPVRPGDLPAEGLDITLLEEGTGRVVGRFHWTPEQLADVLNNQTPIPWE